MSSRALIPAPVTMEERSGVFSVQGSLTIAAGSEGEIAAALLREHLARSGVTTTAADGAALSLAVDEGQPAEGYELVVDEGAIRIRGGSPRGVLWGVQSLVQLGEVEGGTWRVPAVRIVDAPRYSWRGAHLDVCRHFFSKEFVKRFIDLLALHKLNTFHWHLTEDQGWRVEIERYPRLTEVGAWRTESDGTRHGGFYSRADIREVVAHAEARGVSVVPEIEMPGHALAALAGYPELACTGGPFEVTTEWGIFEDVYCAGSDATFEFLENVLEEVIALFPGTYLHVGGDEVPKTRWRECPRCRERIRKEGLTDEDELQSWFIGRMSRFLEARGRRLVGWDEILEGGLAPGATVMSWRGMGGGVRAAQLGHDVVMSPTSHCYFDYAQSDAADEPGAHGVIPLETVYEFEPTPPELDAAQARHVLGTQGNVWTEQMATEERVDFMAFPRLCALAEVAWSPAEKREWRGFRERLEAHLERLDARDVHYRKLES